MAARQGSNRRGLIWAVVGGLVLVVGVASIIVSAVLSQQPPPTSPPTDHPSSDGPSTSSAAGEVVDPAAAERGWGLEPITSDAKTYIRAALAAASTFDTQKSTRQEWLEYLDTWFTPDTRYSEDVRAERMKAAQVELRQGVVLPQEEWDSLANEDGRVMAAVAEDVTFVSVSDDTSGDMSIGTADVTLIYTRSDGSGGETSYDEQVRVSVQVLCGPGSVPTPDTSQQAGDCKVVRYFTEPLEP